MDKAEDNKVVGHYYEVSRRIITDVKDGKVAYAEITTDADGKLTAVTFMDKAEDNKVVGHYYEVSRRIITDVKDGKVAYGDAKSYFYDDENLYSVGYLDVTDTDLDKDVKYYSINGRPEINGKVRRLTVRIATITRTFCCPL